MEFRKKTECTNYCTKNNLVFFQRDLNHNAQKIFIADTYENIWRKIKENGMNSHYYESWSTATNTPVKLYIDYDKKNEKIETDDLKKRVKKIEDNPNSHKMDLLNIINAIRDLLPGITSTNILKSIPDIEKKSYHIIFEGIYFASTKSIQIWLEEQLKHKFKDLFENKIIDLSVYKAGCMRTLLSTKCGQNRPLYLIETDPFLTELQEIPVSANDTTYEQFLKTCITNIEADSVLFNYKTEKKKDNSKKVHLMNDEDIYSDKEVVRKYLDILDPKRWGERGSWLNVGYILSSISRDYIDLWHYFSSKWENYNEADTNIAWESFVSSEYIYTVENLKYLAKIDNTEDYQELTKDIPNHDIKYLRPFDNILSKLIYRLYGDKFVCSDCEKRVWYFFNEIRWCKENKSFNLRKKIIDEVFTKLENYRRQLIKEGASDEIVKNYHNILRMIGSGTTLNCLELNFYNSKFDKIIDQNKDVIGFDNGVYSLIDNEFRKGRASDYISMSTNYEYIEYTDDHYLYIELQELISQILPDELVREYTLKSMASCLDGHTRDENFYMWTGKHGSGGNGKTLLSDLLLKTLGDYGCIAPVSLFTGKRESANNANSAVVGIRNKRCVFMQEPSATDQIQVDVMKSFTGGDTISARELNSSQIEFKIDAKFFMAMNKLCSLSGTDGGTSRRLKITEFTSVFVENPNLENLKRGVHEFKVNKDLKSNIYKYAPVFMSILINYYYKYRQEGLKPPDSITKVTKKFESDNDSIKQFIDENISIGGSKDIITREDLKILYNKDYTLKSNFGKFPNFVTQLENALCTELRIDLKSKAQKLVGFFIKGQVQDSDNEDNEDNEDLELN